MTEKFQASKIKWEDDDQDDSMTSQEQSGEENFADMLDGASEALDNGPRIRVGEMVTGTITSIGAEGDVFVDLGIKNVGIISRDELLDKNGELTKKSGDQLEALVISRKGAEIYLSLTLSASLKSKRDVEAAFANKIPVRGKVTGQNKGGFEITVAGLKAFCPISQIDTKFVDDKTIYMGKDFEFLIEKMEGSKNVVVSRAAALRVQQESLLEQIAEDLEKDGDKVYDGVVTGVRDFGAFVDIGGVEGLVFRSEIIWGRVDTVSDFVSIGDQVRVKVLKIEKAGNIQKMSLSMKGAIQDPWETITEDFKVSDDYKGKVVKLEKFGAFVEIGRGLEGLVHISEMSWVKRVSHPSEILSVGGSVDVRVLSIDTESRRIQLSLKSLDDDPWSDVETKYALGSLVKGKVDVLKSFGAIIDIAPGLSGLLPISTLKKTYGNTYRKSFLKDCEVEVKISAIDMGEKKILLTVAEAAEDEDSYKNYEAYVAEDSQRKEEAAAQKGEKMGALGLALAAKLKR